MSLRLKALANDIDTLCFIARALYYAAANSPNPAVRMYLKKAGDMVSRFALRMSRLVGPIAAMDVVSTLRMKDNISDSVRWFGDFQKQIKFATAVALTRTARRLVPLMEAEVKKVFDNPTQFIVKSFGTTPATKANLTATLFIKDRQAKVLLPHIVGASRSQKLFERKLASDTQADGYWVPGAGAPLNAAGNMTRAQIVKIANKLKSSGKYKDVFIGQPHAGTLFGIWARSVRGRGRGALSTLLPLLIKVQQPHYKQRFDFKGVAERNAQKIFNEEFNRAFSQAKQSIKPVSNALR